MIDPLVIDIETDGLDPRRSGRLLCVGYSYAGVYRVLPHVEPVLIRLLANPEVTKVTHGKFDLIYLRRMGYDVRGPVHDTMVMAWVGNENQPLDLETLAKKYCKITMDKRLVRVANTVKFRCDDGTQMTMDEAPYNQLKDYNRGDVVATTKLYDALSEQMRGSGWLDYFLTEEVPFTSLLMDMELAGLPIDLEAVQVLRKQLDLDNQFQETKLTSMVGYRVNWNAPDQVRKVLFEGLYYEDGREPVTKDHRKELKEQLKEGHVQWGPLTVTSVGTLYAKGHYLRKGLDLVPTPPNPKSKTKKPAVDRPALMEHHPTVPLVQEYLKWKAVEKVCNTYLDVYPEKSHEGRLYGRFSQTGTKTGRLSSSGPNLQNQPSKGELGQAVRQLFRGKLVIGDYSQLEPRLMAHFSGDEVLSSAYKEKKDVYLITAKSIFRQTIHKTDPRRELAKTLFLGDQYGAGPKKLKSILAVNGFPLHLHVVKQYQERLRETYSTLYEWKDQVRAEAHKKGYVVTLAGRKRRLRQSLDSPDWKLMGYGERQAVNAVVQGSAADVVRRCMLAVDEQFMYLRTLAQVHDEVIWESSWDVSSKMLSKLAEVMQEDHGFNLDVPLVFEPVVANTWADKGQDGLEWEIDND